MIKYVLAALMTLSLSPALRAQEAAPEAPAPAAETPAAQGPRIACDEPEFDFGVVDNIEYIDHTFIIKNVGDTTLEISNVRPACGCTVANLSEKMIAPGGQSELTARLSIKGRSGPQSKAIMITSNDPENPQYRVNLSGNIQPAVQVSPDRLIFGQMSPGQQAELFIELTGISPDPFTVLKIETNDPHLISTAETIEEGKRHRISAKLTAPENVGPMNAVIRITTDHPTRQIIEVPVAANVVGELVYAPSELPLSASEGASLTRYIVVRKGNLANFEIKEVITPDPAMKTTIFPFGDQGYRIQVENISPTEAINGKDIKILTTAETMSEISIPIRINP